jgi:alpha-1,2-mannosyltransferase
MVLTFNRQHPLVVIALGTVVGAIMAVLVYTQSLKEFYLDFRVYFLGAHNLFNPHLYELKSNFDLHFPFTYPPVAAIFFWPLTLLSFHAAAFVWTTATLVALAIIVRLSLRLARPELTARALHTATFLMTGLVIALEPIWQNFHFGQVNIVLGAMTMLDVMDRPHRRLPRGVLLAVATSIKLIPGIFILFLFLRRDFRAAITAGATVVFLNLLALALNHQATIKYWTKYAFDPKRMGGVLYNSNQSIRGSVQRLAHHAISPTICTALSALALIVGLSIAVYIAARRSQLAAIVTVGITGDLVSPISWSHHLIWFIPLLAWLTMADDRPRGGPLLSAIIIISCTDYFIWIPPHVGSSTLHWTAFQSVVGNFYFFVMLLVLVIVASGRRRWSSSPSPMNLASR